MEYKNPVVIDAHCHMRPRRAGVEFTPQFIIDNMDAAGVDKIVSLGGGGNPLKNLRENNDFNIQAARDYPERIIPFIYFDTRYEEDGIEEIHRCMEKARDIIKGVKVGHKFAVARAMYPMMETAQEYGLPVGIHSDCKVTGHPYIIGDLANSFPKVSTIILHMGAGPPLRQRCYPSKWRRRIPTSGWRRVSQTPTPLRRPWRFSGQIGSCSAPTHRMPPPDTGEDSSAKSTTF